MHKGSSSWVDKINVLVASIATPPYRNAESLQFSKYLKFMSSPRLSLSLVTAKDTQTNKGWRQVDENYRNAVNSFTQIIKVPVNYPGYAARTIQWLVPRYFQRPDNERLFLRGWKNVVRNLVTGPDIIYSRSMPISSTLMAQKLQQHYGVPWIMHLSDPWTFSPLANYQKPVHRYHLRQEFECFSRASKICLTSHDQIELYRKKYPQFKQKLEWFPNVFDDDLVSVNDIDFSGPLTFVHTGNFYGEKRTPETYLKAIELAASEIPGIADRCRFLFAGFQESAVTDLMQQFGKYGVEYMGPMQVSETIRLQRSSTVLVAIDLDLPSEQSVFFPSKILDYMAARKPILAITAKNSTVYKEVNNRLGKCYGHTDIDGIKNYIVEIFNKYQSKDKYLKAPYEIDYRYAASNNAQRLGELICNTVEA